MSTIPQMSGKELQTIITKMITENEAIEGHSMSASDWLFELGCYLVDDAQTKSLPEVEAELGKVIPELN